MRDTRGPDGLRFARAESDRGHSHDMMDMLAVGGDDPKPPANTCHPLLLVPAAAQPFFAVSGSTS